MDRHRYLPHSEDRCSCGNDHHHHNGHSHHEHHCPYHIHGHMHEGAAAVSGRLVLPGSLSCYRDAVSKMLEGIAAQIRELDGIIGHIKASATESKSAVFSVTKDVAAVTPCDSEELDLGITVIAFGVELGTLEHLLHEALEKLENKENANERF